MEVILAVRQSKAMSWQSDTLEHTLVKVHVLQVDRKPENIAELTAGRRPGKARAAARRESQAQRRKRPVR
jgi:hypothetical protein